MISTLAEQADALAAKDAEIERLRRDLGLAAQHAAAADAECERRIAAHQAAEAEVARMKAAQIRQLGKPMIETMNSAVVNAIATERERCARVAESFEPWEPDEAFMRKRPEEGEVIQANYDRTQAIAAAIRAG